MGKIKSIKSRPLNIGGGQAIYIYFSFNSYLLYVLNKTINYWAIAGAFLWICLLSTPVVHAQKFNIKTYSVNDGLPSSNVYDVYPDDFGYLWFATSVGLVRFDGEHYQTFGEEDGLKDVFIYDLYIDNTGLLWVSTESGGIARLNGNRFEYPTELAELDTVLVTTINGRNDELWIGTNTLGLLVWNRSQNTLERIDISTGLPSNHIWDIYFNENDVWLATKNGIARYSKKEGILQTDHVNNELEGEVTYQVLSDTEGRLWVATSRGISILNKDGSVNNIRQINGVKLGMVFTLAQDEEGTIWIGTERKGLFLYKDGRYTHITRDNGLSSNFVFRLVPGKDGTIWVATDGDGVSIFKDMNFRFYDGESALRDNHVFSAFYGSDGTLWLGTEEGLVSKKGEEFTTYTFPDHLYTEDEIWDIEELPNGHLLLLTYTYEVLEFDGQHFFVPDFYRQLETEVYPTSILVDEDGSIWMSTFSDLYHFKDNTFAKYSPPNEQNWQTEFSYLYKDSYGVLWVSTQRGVATFIDGKFTYYRQDSGIIGNNIYEINESPDGSIWVGSNAGISFATRASITKGHPTFKDFYSKELYTQETIFLLFDQHGGLWQGTNSGLNYIDVARTRQTGKLHQLHFPLTNQRRGVEMNGAARVLTPDGTLWFGSNSIGLVSYTFNNDSGHVAFSAPPDIFLREIRIDNEIIFNQGRDSLFIPHGILPFNHNDLVFRFNTIDYLNPSGIDVYYRLKGYDDEWQHGVDLSEIRYTNLPWGQYELQMRVKSIRSALSSVHTMATIEVMKPVYLTIPFFIVVFLGVGFIVFVCVRYFVSRMEKKELQQLVDERTAELSKTLKEKEVLIKEIHHRVKNNLAVISGLLELQGFKMLPGEAKQAIQESKMRIIAMAKVHENLYQHQDLANVDFQKFIRELVPSIQITMDLEDKDIQVAQHIDKVFLSVNMGVPLGLIINELVLNCYKHAFVVRTRGTVTITFLKKEDHYLLEVSDDGVGAHDDILTQKSESLGITLIKSLTAQLKASISYQNDQGSTFTITIPKP